MRTTRLALLSAAATLALAACSQTRSVTGTEGGGSGCTICHGGTDNTSGAPPAALSGDPADPAIGAHTAHVDALGIIGASGCSVCHGANPGGAGHSDGTPPAVIDFTGLAVGVETPVTTDYVTATRTCTVYCHGVSLSDGADTIPDWSQTSLAGAPCGSCHGYPPTSVAPHTAGMTSCTGCHPYPNNHMDGTVDASTGCTTCHGGTDNQTGAPPVDTHGATTGNYVGAHTAHVDAQIGCATCHPNPGGAGHNDGGRAEITFSGLATDSGNFTTSYAASTFTCTVYCHGASLADGADSTPSWPDSSIAGGCGACHGNPPLSVSPHTASTTTCTNCHPAPSGTTHMDGTLEVSGHAAGYATGSVHGPDAIADLASCQGCHGDAFDGNGVASMDCNACHTSQAGWNAQALATNCTFCHGQKTKSGYPTIANPLKAAPPDGVTGATAATDPSVGAHAAHLTAGAWANAFACSDCHAVPADLAHVDGTVLFSWSAFAQGGGTPTVTQSGNTVTCTNYCHGATINTSAPSSPAWTATSISCTGCHGSPPSTGKHTSSAHTGAPCTFCHIGYTAGSGVNLDYHVNGTKDVVFLKAGGTGGETYTLTGAGWDCSTCHNNNANYNP
jgi:predicted CxxxxCH...CXXCH cytochrome family protein